MDVNYCYFQAMRKLLKRAGVRHTVYGEKLLDIEQGGALIRELLEADAPCMIGRIGSTEMQAINAVYTERAGLRRSIPDIYARILYSNAGFFPEDTALLKDFAVCYEDAAQQLDLAGLLMGRDEDYFYHRHAPAARMMELCALEPYYAQQPWSQALAGKRVLVVHPFEKTIRQQYARREKLFADPRILPEFELQTLKAVQSIGSNTGGFSSWFEALDSMKQQMEHREFDVALIGCGAYSFPLAAHARKLGRKSVVVGGALQIVRFSWFLVNRVLSGKRSGYFEQKRRLLNGIGHQIGENCWGSSCAAILDTVHIDVGSMPAKMIRRLEDEVAGTSGK